MLAGVALPRRRISWQRTLRAVASKGSAGERLCQPCARAGKLCADKTGGSVAHHDTDPGRSHRGAISTRTISIRTYLIGQQRNQLVECRRDPHVPGVRDRYRNGAVRLGE